MKRFVWMIILTFGALLVSFPSLAMTDGRWVIKGNISQSGRINFPAVEDNGRIYLLGGTTGKWGYSTNSVDVFDPQTGSWSSASPMKEKKSSFVGLAYQGKIYVVGGIREGGEIYLKTVEIYDPETNTWSKGNPMPSQRGWIKGAVANGKIYILGGVNPPSTKKMNPTSPAINEEGTYDLFNPHSQQQKYYVFHLTNEVETYDPSTNTWAQGPAMKDSLYNFALASLNDTIYLFGGEDQSGKVQDTLYILNTRTNSWSQGATLPVARANFQAVVLENKIFLLGGFNDTSWVRQVDVYDSETDTWSSASPMNIARYGLGAAQWNNRIYALGGGKWLDKADHISSYEVFETGEVNKK